MILARRGRNFVVVFLRYGVVFNWMDGSTREGQELVCTLCGLACYHWDLVRGAQGRSIRLGPRGSSHGSGCDWWTADTRRDSSRSHDLGWPLGLGRNVR